MIKKELQRYYAKWLSQRMPASRQQRLRQRLIFIVPTGYGFLFLAVAMGVFIGGINYQNNLLLGLSFFLASQFVLVILATYRNLAGLSIEAQHMRANFPGEQGYLSFTVTARRSGAQIAIELRWRGKDSATQMVSLAAEQSEQVTLAVPLVHRGWNAPGRLQVVTRYPMGLLRAWSQLDMAHECLAWPTPVSTPHAPFTGHVSTGDAIDQRQQGEDDFYGLRTYTESDSPSQIDWKSYAQGRGLYVQEFIAPQASSEWLDWYSFHGGDVEQRLSWLCYWVLKREQERQPYGLRLPNFELPISLGVEQRARALEALALYAGGESHG